MSKRRNFILFSLSIASLSAFGFLLHFMFRVNRATSTVVGHGTEILIISMQASGGHMAAAKAIKSKIESQYGYRVDIMAADEAEPLMLGTLYEQLITTMTGRFILGQVTRNVYWDRGGDYYTSFGVKILEYLISRGNYSCIISVLPLSYKFVTKSLAQLNSEIPYIILPTDWEDPCLGSGYWIEGSKALYLLGTERLWEQCPVEYRRKKISGMIIRPEFTEDVKPKAVRRQELGLPQDKPIVLFMFGKCASADMTSAALSLRNARDCHYVFICGTSKQIKESIDRIKEEFNCDHYTVYGLVDKPHVMMQASDIFIGKPGPGALTEAMCYQLPILYSSNVMLEQEKFNGRYITESGLGHGFKKPKELLKLIPQVIRDMPKYHEAYEKKVKKNNALNEVCEVIHEVIEKGQK